MARARRTQPSTLNMATADLSPYLNAIRENDQEAFSRQLSSSAPSPDWLNQHHNDARYANWFSGIGFTLLQITSYLKPKWTTLLLDLGVTLDLHSACALGNTNAIEELLSKNPEAIHHEIDTYYPAQFAFRHPKALRTLLENGDNADRPLKKLAWFSWEDPAAERGKSDWRLMHMLAVGRSTLEAAEVLKEFGADLDAISKPFGESPIHLSAIYNRTDFIRWFVENGVAVDTPTADQGQCITTTDLFENEPFQPFKGHGTTPLMCALGEGQSKAVELLIELGADVNAKNSADFSPLHYAAGAFWQEDVTNVELLLDHGARRDATDSEGRHPVDLAAAKGYAATRQRLTAEPQVHRK